MTISSTGRVRQYRQRQSEAGRKLVRFYLDLETSAKLDQLAGDQPHAKFAEELLTAAIAQAWSDRTAQQQRASQKQEGRRLIGNESAASGAARIAQFAVTRPPPQFRCIGRWEWQVAPLVGVARNAALRMVGLAA